MRLQEIRGRKTHSPLESLRSCDRGSTHRQPPHIKSRLKSNRALNRDHAGSRARPAARFQETRVMRRRGHRSSKTRRGARRSGQLALAANPQIFLGFHQRHPQQMGEQVELVASRQLGERRQALGDEHDGLLRTAIAKKIIRSRTPIPDGRAAPDVTQWLFQTNASKLANLKQLPSKRACLQGCNLQPFG